MICTILGNYQFVSSKLNCVASSRFVRNFLGITSFLVSTNRRVISFSVVTNLYKLIVILVFVNKYLRNK